MILELQRFVAQSGKIEHKKEIFSILFYFGLAVSCMFKSKRGRVSYCVKI